MSEAPANPTETQMPGNGDAEFGVPQDWEAAAGARPRPRPDDAGLAGAAQVIPLLHAPGARPLVRDRWERLVTTIDIPAPPEEVWGALTEPQALKQWLALCRGSITRPRRDCILDFEDGEFFLCRPVTVEPPNLLRYFWRWLGIGQATSVTWSLEPSGAGTSVTVTEEACNPPWDWQTWNGGGWPGILEQLAAYLRTGMEWRWPWRRMGPYAQIELAAPLYEAWDRLFTTAGLKYWLLAAQGEVAPGQSLPIFMGDASGLIEMKVREVVRPGQSPPSFLPYVTFSLSRKVWGDEIGGRLWLEPAGWGRSLFQVFHYNWENLPAGLQLSERRILTNYWAGAMRRASQACSPPLTPLAAQNTNTSPHNWS